MISQPSLDPSSLSFDLPDPEQDDLSNIDFIDSSGLGAMVKAAKKCTQSKRAFSVVGNPRVVQTIKLVRLEEFLHLAPDLNTAISKLSS